MRQRVLSLRAALEIRGSPVRVDHAHGPAGAWSGSASPWVRWVAFSRLQGASASLTRSDSSPGHGQKSMRRGRSTQGPAQPRCGTGPVPAPATAHPRLLGPMRMGLGQGGREDLAAAVEAAPDAPPPTTERLTRRDVNPQMGLHRSAAGGPQTSVGTLSLGDTFLTKPSTCFRSSAP